jgi:RNA recognition motif-containing protein
VHRLTSSADNSIRGFAYIEFESHDDAEEAIFNMNDAELYNRVIHVEVAKPHRGLAGLDTSLPGAFLLLVSVRRLIGVVWQQEEWIKANVNRDQEGQEDGDAMQELEQAQKP